MASPVSEERAAAGVKHPAQPVAPLAVDTSTHPAPGAGSDMPGAPPCGHIASPSENLGETRPRSLFGGILDWMLAPLLLLWPISIAITYFIAKAIANGPFDRALETRVNVLAQQIQPVNGVAELSLPVLTRDFFSANNASKIVYQVRGTHGELLAGDASLPLPHEGKDSLPPPGLVAFRNDMLHGRDIRVAYASVELPHAALAQPPCENLQTRAAKPGCSLPAFVQVAETVDERNQLANDIIKGVILPQFVILPLAIVLVWFGLSRGLAPLTTLQASLRARHPNDISPLEAQHAPPEIAPLVTSFNDLLARLAKNIELQKRFIADAAHQMKTPLAGLRTQAELALRHDVSAEVRRSLEHIATSSEHAARLVTQLLTLARAENRMPEQAFETIEIAALARQAVHDWVQPALAKQMDLGYEGPDSSDASVMIDGNALMLREMLSNLIDNAIRYTPEGGRITVRVRLDTPDTPDTVARSVHLEIEDTGPGIPLTERTRVLERFYRILGREGDGSGLGLAIVSEIVAMHRGALTISDNVYRETPRLAGTLVRVSLQTASPIQDLP
jgi:two-component system sensor histidine kinase TctE